jgi:hypothetical protein
MMMYSHSQFLIIHPLLGDVILKISGRHVMSSHPINYLQICLKRDKSLYLCIMIFFLTIYMIYGSIHPHKYRYFHFSKRNKNGKNILYYTFMLIPSFDWLRKLPRIKYTAYRWLMKLCQKVCKNITMVHIAQQRSTFKKILTARILCTISLYDIQYNIIDKAFNRW